MWILKPGAKSKGEGIEIHNDLNMIIKTLKNNNDQVAQKYIERPLLYKQRKFDIRAWVIFVNSKVRDCSAYLFEEQYLRLSSKNYDVTTSDKYIHLTNNAIQKHSVNFTNNMNGCMVEKTDF